MKTESHTSVVRWWKFKTPKNHTVTYHYLCYSNYCNQIGYQAVGRRFWCVDKAPQTTRVQGRDCRYVVTLWFWQKVLILKLGIMSFVWWMRTNNTSHIDIFTGADPGFAIRGSPLFSQFYNFLSFLISEINKMAHILRVLGGKHCFFFIVYIFF